MAAAPPTDDAAPSTIASLADQVAAALDRTSQRLGGAPPLSSGGGGAVPSPIDRVDSSAAALIAAIGRYGPDDWRAPRDGETPAIDILRAGIAEAGALVRRASALTESTD